MSVTSTSPGTLAEIKSKCMHLIVHKQRDFFNSNITKDVDFRIRQLKKLERVLKENELQLNEAIYADFQKSSFDNYTTELGLVYHDIHEAVANVKKWAKIKSVKTNLLNFPAKSYIVPEPLGVCLVIGAGNFPYQISLAPAVAAIAAGNTVILKPSEVPKNTSNAMATIINSNFESNYFKVVEGGIPETTELLNQKFDKIFFTGSAPVGRIVYKAAAKNLTPVTLELGGKSPAFITEHCDLDISAKRIVWAKFLNAGQTCIAPDYVFVHKAIKHKFLQKVKEEIEKSNFSFGNDNYVQIINQKNVQRLADMLIQEKIYSGGRFDLESRYFEPTIMTDVSFEDRVMQDEIFGPILPVIEYENIDEAIAKVKERPKPLSCYVFTSDKQIRDKIIREISFGGGAVNDAVMHISNSHMAFGGVGESGMGNYHGESGFKAFTHYKSILDKATWLETNLKYYPHTKMKLALLKFLMK